MGVTWDLYEIMQIYHAYLQARDLLSKALLLLSQDALVQLCVGLHDALLGRQHFLKVKILTRGDATTKQRHGRANRYIDTHTYARRQAHTQQQGNSQANQGGGGWLGRGGHAVRGAASTTEEHACTINANALPTTTLPRQRGMQEERETTREKREEVMSVWSTFLQKLPKLHPTSHRQCIGVCVCVMANIPHFHTQWFFFKKNFFWTNSQLLFSVLTSEYWVSTSCF